MDQLVQDAVHYANIFKIFVFPEFSFYTEYIIAAAFEAKQHANLKNFDYAFKLLEFTAKHLR